MLCAQDGLSVAAEDENDLVLEDDLPGACDGGASMKETPRER
jgi:hypothetical protein